MTHNKHVENINKREFDSLKGDLKTFPADDSNKDEYISKLLGAMLPNVSKNLLLKIGAQVSNAILIENMDLDARK